MKKFCTVRSKTVKSKILSHVLFLFCIFFFKKNSAKADSSLKKNLLVLSHGYCHSGFLFKWAMSDYIKDIEAIIGPCYVITPKFSRFQIINSSFGPMEGQMICDAIQETLKKHASIKNIFFIGHSQGCANIIHALHIMHENIRKKVKAMILLAPLNEVKETYLLRYKTIKKIVLSFFFRKYAIDTPSCSKLIQGAKEKYAIPSIILLPKYDNIIPISQGYAIASALQEINPNTVFLKIFSKGHITISFWNTAAGRKKMSKYISQCLKKILL